LTAKGKFVFGIAIILIIIILIGVTVGIIEAKKKQKGGGGGGGGGGTCPIFGGPTGSPIPVPNSSDDSFCTYEQFLFDAPSNVTNSYQLFPQPSERQLDAVPHCIDLCKNHPTCTAVNTDSQNNPTICWGYDADPADFANHVDNKVGGPTFTEYMSLLRPAV